MKNYITILIISVVVALGVNALIPVSNTHTVTKEVKEVQLGGNPEFDTFYTKVGGINEWRMPFPSLQTGSNTIAYFQSPASTSTLLSAACRFDSGSTTAMTVQFAKNTTQYGTTTVFGSNGTIGANSGGYLIASSSAIGAQPFFPPNTYLTVGAYGTVAGTVSPTGSCYAVFLQP